jgi:hypothetical protein
MLNRSRARKGLLGRSRRPGWECDIKMAIKDIMYEVVDSIDKLSVGCSGEIS